MSGTWEDVSAEIVELVKENLSTPDQMIPYAERLFSALLSDINAEFVSSDIQIMDTTNGVDIVSAYNPKDKVSLIYFPDFYFDESMIILEYNVFANEEPILAENLPISEGIETFDKFRENLMQDIGNMIDAGSQPSLPPVEESNELINEFLYLNNYLPDNLKTADPYKLIEVIRVLLDGSNRIRKVTQK